MSPPVGWAWKVATGAASVLIAPLSALLAVGAASTVAGGNVSDVGVAMYERGQLAVVAGVATYLLSAAALLGLLFRTGGEHRRVPSVVSLPLALLGLVLTTLALQFTYG